MSATGPMSATTSFAPAPAVRAGRRARLLGIAAALLAALIALTALRLAMTNGAFRNSDDSSNFLAGLAMAAGNWRLHGWRMAPDNYLPTEVLAQAVLKWLFGIHPTFMRDVEAVVWAAIALVGTGLACWGAERRHLLATIGIALSLLAFNIFEHNFSDFFLSTVASHGFTILLTLLVFTLVIGPHATAAAAPVHRGLRPLLLAGCMTIGSFADPIFIVVACLPVLALRLLELPSGPARRRGGPRGALVDITVTLGAVALARLLIALNVRTGGFQSLDLDITLATFQQVFDRLGFALESLARLFGANFFGRALHPQSLTGSMIYLLRLPLLLGLAVVGWEIGAGMFARIRSWPTDTSCPRLELDQLLWLSMVLCIASTVMAGLINDPSCARFFLPAAVTGGILVARRFARIPLMAWYGTVVTLASIAAAVAAMPRSTAVAIIAVPSIDRIVDTLRAHGLVHGYAGYWQGTIVTVLAKNRITSLPIILDPAGHLHPLTYFCDTNWFAAAAHDWRGRVFVIAAQPPGWLDVPQSTALAQFGTPIEHYNLDQLVIDVYQLPNPGLAALVP